MRAERKKTHRSSHQQEHQEQVNSASGRRKGFSRCVLLVRRERRKKGQKGKQNSSSAAEFGLWPRALHSRYYTFAFCLLLFRLRFFTPISARGNGEGEEKLAK